MRWKTERGCDRLLRTFHRQVLLESCRVNFSSTFLWKTVLLLDWEVYDGHSPEFFQSLENFCPERITPSTNDFTFAFFSSVEEMTPHNAKLWGGKIICLTSASGICLRQFLEFFTMRFNFKVKYCLDFRERNCMQLSSLILCPFLLNMYLI